MTARRRQLCDCTRTVRRSIDDVVKIPLFATTEKFELATGTAAATHVHMNIGVALLDVPFDWPGLAPKKLRARRKTVVVEPIGRRSQQGRIRTRAIRAMDAGDYRRSVTDIDFDDLIDHQRQLPSYLQ